MTVITTARKPDGVLENQAMEIGLRYGVPFVARGNQSLDAIIALHQVVMLLSREHLSCHTQSGEFFLHPNMAAVRVKLLRQGKADKMLDVMDLRPRDSFLDCTAGFCADSLVAKYRVGEQGRVVALENSLPVYIVVAHGLEHYSGPERFSELAEGIELIHADYREYLAALPARSFDIVYFDPMFDVPVMKSSSLLPLRPLACRQPLTPADLELAARVARRRVVVKQRSFFDFPSLGLTPAAGGQNRKVAYGVLEIKENENA